MEFIGKGGTLGRWREENEGEECNYILTIQTFQNQN